MAAIADLVDRSGPLKAQLRVFSQQPCYDDAYREVMSACGVDGTSGEGKLVSAVDHLLLQHRLPDGQTIVEKFVAARPDLPAPEREMMLGWRDVVEGIFEISRYDGEVLVVRNLLDELAYRVRSNMGQQVFRSFRSRSFMIARLVPVQDEWLVSGVVQPVDRQARDAMYKLAAELAQERPELVFRNRDLLERGWELQRAYRDRFVRFFGADMIRVPGPELGQKMQDYLRYSREEILAASAATRDADARASWALPATDFPPHLVEPGTAAVIYDEIEGLSFFAGWGEFEQAFVDPGALDHRRYPQRVADYLEDDSVSPLPFRRMAQRDARRASEVLRLVLGRKSFDWQRDGEQLMREHKPSFFERTPLPRIVPLRRLAPYAGAPEATSTTGRRSENRRDPHHRKPPARGHRRGAVGA